jgi:hypothetical protein
LQAAPVHRPDGRQHGTDSDGSPLLRYADRNVKAYLMTAIGRAPQAVAGLAGRRRRRRRQTLQDSHLRPAEVSPWRLLS